MIVIGNNDYDVNGLPGGATHAAPASEPLPTYEANEERTEEEDVEDEELKAPVELIIEVK